MRKCTSIKSTDGGTKPMSFVISEPHINLKSHSVPFLKQIYECNFLSLGKLLFFYISLIKLAMKEDTLELKLIHKVKASSQFETSRS